MMMLLLLPPPESTLIITTGQQGTTTTNPTASTLSSFRTHKKNPKIPLSRSFHLYLERERKGSTLTMSHESVWYSHPRTYGKGSIGWSVLSQSLFPPQILNKREGKKQYIMLF